jgi:pilus assembly protein CpaE
MLSTVSRTTQAKLEARVVTPDASLGRRLKAAIDVTGRYQAELLIMRLRDLPGTPRLFERAHLLILDIDQAEPSELAMLEEVFRALEVRPAVVVLARELGEAATRQLLKLRIADWLPTSCTDRELVLACEQALLPGAGGEVRHGRSTTFMPAVGGAGATTLSVAAAAVLAGGSRTLSGCCVVDLDFQSGTVAEYVDVAPALQLGDIHASPDRLDGQMLEVMLSRHASGLAVLAAPPVLGGFEAGFDAVSVDAVGRLLDLASLKFSNLIIDLPRHWMPWSESVLRGSDAVFLVTEMTVVGLRKARQLLDLLEQRDIAATKLSVIVNKVPWLGGGLRKADAREALGERLAGFVSADARLVREAQNRGLLLSQVRRNNRIEKELRALLGKRQRLS